MHYGPKGSGDEGFGCAMFVAYCYNQVFFGGNRGDFELDNNPHEAFYGATTLFWANVAPGAEHYNRGFVEVNAADAVAGDVVAQITQNTEDPYSSRLNCGHVGLYTGNGMWMEAGGGDEHPIDMNNKNYHYLHYTGYGMYS
jgi:cell wall-associated NlpC family hydrolase